MKQIYKIRIACYNLGKAEVNKRSKLRKQKQLDNFEAEKLWTLGSFRLEVFSVGQLDWCLLHENAHPLKVSEYRGRKWTVKMPQCIYYKS